MSFLNRRRVITLVTLLVLTPAARAGVVWPVVTVRFEPSQETVVLGQQFTMDLVADIYDHPVVGWGLDLKWDPPQVISLVDAVIASPWIEAFAEQPDPDDPAVLVDLAAVAFSDGVSGTVTLATLTFQAVEEGQTNLILGDHNPAPHDPQTADLTEGFALDPSGVYGPGDFADVTYDPGYVTVIPEPEALLLLALGALAALKRRGRCMRRGQYTGPTDVGPSAERRFAQARATLAALAPGSNREGGGLADPVLSHHRTYSPYPAVSSTVATPHTVRSGTRALDL